MSPLVSLVITTYNREAFLGQAIASVLQQTFQEFELLIWDDGSSDRSLDIAHAYAQQDPRVQVIAAPHQGRVAALAAAIAQTTGTYLGWVDSDDWLAPTALSETVRVLAANPTTGMVYTDYYETNATGQVQRYGSRCQIPYSPVRLLVDFMTFHFRLLRRSLYHQIGGIDHSLDFVEDYDLCLRLSEVTQIQRVPQPLYFYRVHSDNASHQLNLEQTLRTHTILKQALIRRGMAASHAIDLDLATGHFTLRSIRNPDRLRIPVKHLVPFLASFPLIGALQTGRVYAQSIIPANDGTNTVVTPVGNQFDITGGTLSGNGANLFHSFGQFGLTQGQVANFIANPQLQNILSRVVGNNPSIINGLIQVTGGAPNLYLLNPAGIVFGPTASLNVPAAFTATTANALGFNCNTGGIGCDWFSATGASNFAVLNGVPNGLAFGGSQPGAIVNAGNLAVNTGQTLALLGGTVVNTGQLTAPDGQILLSAVPGQTFVRLNQPGNLLSVEFQPPATPLPDGVAPTLAQLLTGGNLGNATGLTVDAGGTVRLVGAGGQIPDNAATTIASGSISTAGQTGGAIALLGRQVGLVGAALTATGTTGGGNVFIGGDLQGLGTLPTARQTFISPDSTINASALQSGNGGRVIVWADQTTTFGGTILAQGGTTSGDGGFVEVSGKETLNFRGNVDLTAPNGQTGTLLLDPINITIINGAGGPDDAQISADGAIFAADGGAASFTISEAALETLLFGTNVILQATNDIIIQDLADNILAFADPGFGAGGSITFTAGGVITMLDPNDTIVAPSRDVTLTAGRLALGNINTSSAPLPTTNRGGNITLTATNGSVTAGNLTGNGFALPGGTIRVTSNTSTITVGQIQARSVSAGSPVAAGGGVLLQTLANGGDITFTTIDTSGGFGYGPVPTAGSNVNISASGRVRGTGVLPDTNTITTTGLVGSADGTIQIQHDGGPTNQPFVIGGGAGIANGTAGGINAGGTEAIAASTFGFSSSPFSSPGGRINITFANTPPTIAVANPQLTAPPDQFVNFSVASLGLAINDLNADNLFVRVVAIAPGAILRINGVEAEPGAVIPLDASLQYSPPPGFKGVLANAFTITVDDVISVSSPQSISLTTSSTVNSSLNPGNPCILTTCNTVPPIQRLVVQPSEDALNPTTPEADFTTEYAAYLGIAQPPAVSIDNQREILTQIERETGAIPAFVYVSFVPASLKPDQVAGWVAETKTRIPVAERDDDQLELLVVSARGNVLRRRIPQATRAVVLQIANEFRQEVADPRKIRTTSYLPIAQQLYRWIIAPIQQELGLRQINNLVFLMDAGLRSLPVAALHDGQQFLVEQYSIGLMPSVSLSDTRYRDIREAQLLTFGISQSTQGQPPLPSVEVEVATLVNEIWSGRAYLNQAATLAALRSARQERPYGIIHMATHADFLPGSFDRSFIQLWEQRLQLNQVRELGWNNPQVQLLVLSACSTALGDRDAELGFGGLAVQSGVKSAVASLWAVNDAATAALITRFYKDLQTAPIKARALQDTQKAMIRGQVVIQNGQIRGVENRAILLPESITVRDATLSHPYYWSAFTMIGSPW
jgi:filamentous hemagglutinin family protein